ncbi:MAG: ferredoxin reductase family protein [Actinomycetota bacterium]
MITQTRPESDTNPADPRPAPRPASPAARPRFRRRRAWTGPFFVLANAAAITAWWVSHGGPAQFGSLAGDMVALGQITALLGTFAVLVLLVLISRLPWVERRYGMDHLNHWHRWVGITATTLLTAHVAASTAGFAAATGSGLVGQMADFVLYYPNLLAAAAGFAVLVLVAVTSARSLRRRLRYETWWLLHLYAYLAVALSFAHQITLGSDLSGDPWFRAYWIVLFSGTAAALLCYRWLLPLGRAIRYRLRVATVREASADVVTITLRGRGLHRLPVEAGQFFLLRFLRGDRWWKAHPFSLSAIPDGHSLRFTIKALGDDSAGLRHIPVGTPVMAEGPYGAFTLARATRERLALIAGGIGIAPIRSLLEALHHPPGDVAVLYRARRHDDAVLLDEVATLAGAKQYPLFVSYSRGTSPTPNPLRPEALRQAIPDIAERTVFVCGPAAMIDAARAGLHAAGVPRSQIVYERFGY